MESNYCRVALRRGLAEDIADARTWQARRVAFRRTGARQKPGWRPLNSAPPARLGQRPTPVLRAHSATIVCERKPQGHHASQRTSMTIFRPRHRRRLTISRLTPPVLHAAPTKPPARRTTHWPSGAFSRTPDGKRTFVWAAPARSGECDTWGGRRRQLPPSHPYSLAAPRWHRRGHGDFWLAFKALADSSVAGGYL